nr:unnamed protein product [Callosobruchus analis]
MTIHQIKTFENQNDISVNIYTLKLSKGEYSVVPFRLTKEKRDNHVNLLMIHNQDHDHLVPLNNYRGAAHEGCNINFKDNHTIPVVLHNLPGYDAHFIIKDIALGMNGRVDLLPITKERYIAFTKNISDSLVSFRFIDSFKFMNSSLDKLSSYLTEYPILKSELLQYSEEHIKLLTTTLQTALTNSVILTYHLKVIFLIGLKGRIFLMNNISMLSMYGTHLRLRIWVNTQTYI